jgi:biotin carboxylase
VLLLVPARTYRAADFILAAERMRLDLVVASDGALPLGGRPVIPVSPADPEASVRRILARAGSVDAVVAADTPMLVLAATAAAGMGLPHNPAEALRAAADKAAQRWCWAAAGVPQPSFRLVPARGSVRQAAEAVGFPCVVKAVSLSASQGVLRADDPAAAVEAARRIRQVLDDAERSADEPLLIEEYLPGPELSIDGVLTAGDLTVTAVFDKPGTPDGPTFEETLLVSPSRLAAGTLAAAVRTAADAARSLGLSTGPVHAELRICNRGPAMLELASRSIGGLCSRALSFPGGASLEEIILANALGRPLSSATASTLPLPTPAGPVRPCGVFMLPVPRPGVLRAVEGRAEALAVPGVTGLTITIPPGQRVRPLPDGDRYLGFIFASGDTPADVEQALTAASGRLRVIISDDRPGCRPSS